MQTVLGARSPLRRRSLLRVGSLCCICIILAVGCGTKGRNTPTAPVSIPASEPVIIGINLPRIQSLDPADTDNIIAENLLYNLGDRLYTYEPSTGKLIPQLATASPTISEDQLTYTIPLQKNVKFHDGTDFNAEAMVFSLKRFIQNDGKSSLLLRDIVRKKEAPEQGETALEPQNQAEQNQEAQPQPEKIQDYAIKATGDYEITIELNKPSSLFPNLLSFSGLVAISPQAYKDALGPGKFKPTFFVGTGPYELASFDHDLIQLSVFKKYWGTAPANKGVHIKLYDSNANLFNAFRTGTVDLIYQSLEPVQIEALEQQAQSGDWKVVGRTSNVITYLTLNLKNEDLRNVEVRQAFALMIDRDILKERVFRNQAEPLYSLIPSIFEVSDPVFKTQPDTPEKKPENKPEKIKALLAGAGYSETNPLTLTLGYRSDISSHGVAAKTIEDIIARNYGPLVTVKLEGIESATVYDNLETGTYSVVMLDWHGAFYDPDNYIQPFMDCEQGSTESGCEQGASFAQGSFFFSDRANQLIDNERQEFDPVKRKAFFQELQQILVKEVPFIPLWQNKDYIFAQTNITGIQLQPSQQFSFSSLNKS